MCFLKDSGAFLESKFAGLKRVEIHCNETDQFYNFTNYAWGYQVKPYQIMNIIEIHLYVIYE